MEAKVIVKDVAQGESIRATPLVVIVGRSNVGTSTLFNRLIGERRAIVGDEPGITRDRIYGAVDWSGLRFSLIDTGGIVPDDDAIIPANIFKQAGRAIEDSQVLIWVVDARKGITQLDEELAGLLRTTGKRVLVAANKIDSSKLESESGEFYRFGFEEVFSVSAEQGIGVGELLDSIVQLLRTEEFADEPEEDSEEGITALDANIGGYALDAGRSIIIAVNKWDEIENKETNTAAEFELKLRDKMKFLEWAPVITMSALTGQRVEKILPLVLKAEEARNRRIPTPLLKAFFERTIAQPRAGGTPPPANGDRPRL